MKNKLRRIGLLTAGGDCPGLNAVIRAVTKTAIYDYGIEVFGIEDGFEGLIYKRGHLLSPDCVSGILTHGGTILGTSNKANPFKTPIVTKKSVRYKDMSKQAIANFKSWKLDALVAIGGDGTLKISQKLFKLGIPVVGIPKTIDNDLSETDFTFGFDTAVSIATEALDRLHTTAASHKRVMILEVMGRNAGWIALYSGAAGGADIILIPELPFQMKYISQALKNRAKLGKKFSLIVVAEGAFEAGASPITYMDKTNPYPVKMGGIGNWLMEKIETTTGMEARVAVLGHIQRGGSPTPFDRNLGTLFGKYAMDMVEKEKWGYMVCMKGQKIESVSIESAVQKLKTVPVNHPLVLSARSVGTSFGDR